MNDPFRANRQFERMLFDGVSERPEPIWGRDANANAESRTTLNSVKSGRQQDQESNIDEEESTVIYEFDFSKKTVTIIESDQVIKELSLD